MGVKFLRDGVDSANFVAMHDVDGQKSLNFFEKEWTAEIPQASNLLLKPLEARFRTASDYIETMGMSDMATYDAAGQKASVPEFPFDIKFKPTLAFPDTVADGYTDFREQLATIPIGTTLFEIYATPIAVVRGGIESKIGYIITQSECVPSWFGDNHLYFRHQRFEDDIALKPEWASYRHNQQDDNLLLELEQQGSNCPFAGIIDYLQ